MTRSRPFPAFRLRPAAAGVCMVLLGALAPAQDPKADPNRDADPKAVAPAQDPKADPNRDADLKRVTVAARLVPRDGATVEQIAGRLLLRPNAEYALKLTVANGNAKRVRLAVDLLDAATGVLLARGVAEADGGAKDAPVALEFPKPAVAAAPTAAPPAVTLAAAPGIELGRLPFKPFQMKVRIAAAESGQSEETLLAVDILPPSEYVESALKDNRGGAVSVETKAFAAFAEAGIPVGLGFSPAPAFVGDSFLKSRLAPGGGALTLYAKDMQPAAAGEAYVAVDGIDRAFGYRLADGGRLGERLRIVAPFKTTKPADRMAVVVQAHPKLLWTAVEVALGFDRNGDGRLDPSEETIRVPGARDMHMTLVPSEIPGQITLRSAVRDWVVPMPTEGLRGRWTPVGRMVDASGKSVDSERNAEVFFNPYTLDREKILFAAPTFVPSMKPLFNVSAGVAVPFDNVLDVKFFVGKLPENPVAGVWNAQEKVWKAVLALPPGSKDRIEVGVEATTVLGDKVVVLKTVEVREPAKEPEAPKDAVRPVNLEVTVSEGDRLQNGTAVELLNPLTYAVLAAGVTKIREPVAKPKLETADNSKEGVRKREPVEAAVANPDIAVDECQGCRCTAPSSTRGGVVLFEGLLPGAYIVRAVNPAKETKAGIYVQIATVKPTPATKPTDPAPVQYAALKMYR